MYPEEFKWKVPPYEYVYDRNPFDVISGTDKLRLAIESQVPLDEIIDSWNLGIDFFKSLRTPYLLY